MTEIPANTSEQSVEPSFEHKFVHLRLHTEFSLTDSLIRVKKLIPKVAEMKMPALGITDHNNFFGLVKFYSNALNAGIKPVVGTDIWVDTDDGEGRPTLLTLYAQNDKGYRNLTELISRGYQEGQRQGVPYIKREWIKPASEGVIALSGGKIGDVGMALLGGKQSLAENLLNEWQRIFPDRFYLELQRTGRENDEEYLHAAVALAEKCHTPVVATNDVRFLKSEEFEAHETRVCISEGRALDDPRRERRYSEQQYLRSQEEMCELFSDIPEALENTLEISKRCNVQLLLGTYFLPDYPIPDDFEKDPFFQKMPYAELEKYAADALEEKWADKKETEEYQEVLKVNIFFQKISYEGLEERLSRILEEDDPLYNPKDSRQDYIDRLQFELNIIMQMGFPGYFLIVMDFIQWGKDHDIPVGPGRGSGAGSLVAYAQKITDLDPLKYDLLFERFLNPERVSMPDFDVDFCMEKRGQVINYVADHYGRQAVSQIVTFGTMAAKAVVRDVARALGKSYGLADKLSKMIPFEIGMTLAKALEAEEPLREFLATDADGKEIWDMAEKLEGLTRNLGKHAGGVVIAPTKISDFSAIYTEDIGSGLVTQFDKNDVEEAGLVKFDFLGLRTLTIIDWAVKMINARAQAEDDKKAEADKDKNMEMLDISAIPLDDPETFKLLKRAETTAVFQLESRGMKDLIKRLQPDDLEDMIALVALFRPGPLQSGMVDDFINRKHGRAEVAYPDAKYQHEKLKPILEPTYGVIVYQEQVMQIAQELAGYTLGGADLLRRAMGKKKPEEMAKQRATFEEGAASQGVDPDLAIKIFDLVEKFAGYGFNKSHSAAYAVVSYQTAWLKTHYPSQFMAATMSSDMDKTDKVVTFIEECREMKITLMPPDVNSGEFMFTVNEKDHIIYGLGAIKGLGEGPVESIIEARKDGPFKDLFDFCARIDSRKVNKRALEALVRSGALDSIGPGGDDVGYPRAVMLAAMGEAVRSAEQAAKNASAGMADLFGELVPSAESSDGGDVYSDFRKCRAWSIKERLEGEKETLGLYLTGHPIDEYEEEIKELVPKRISSLQPERKTQQTIAGLVVGMRVMKNKRGENMCFITLDDRTGRIDAAIFDSNLFNEHREEIVRDALLVVDGEVSVDDYNGGLSIRLSGLRTLEAARKGRVKGIRIHLKGYEQEGNFIKQLNEIMAPFKGGKCQPVIRFSNRDAEGDIKLGPDWKLEPDEELIQQLRHEFGREQVEVVY
ncbi:MAG: DNA polymerase III subunit alpha [Cellvibrionaceae bacterium]